MKMVKADYAVIQSIRHAPEVSDDMYDSIHVMANVAIGHTLIPVDWISEKKFSVVIPLSGVYHSLDLSNSKDILIENKLECQLDNLASMSEGKWVITSGNFKGKVFDLTDVTKAKSNILFGLLMDQILRVLNERSSGQIWVPAERRSILKDVKDDLTFLVLNCELDKANPNKGRASFFEIIAKYNKFSSGRSGQLTFEHNDPVRWLDEVNKDLRRCIRETTRNKSYDNRSIDEPCH